MWSCMTIQNLSMMYRMKGRMDQYLYKQILECKFIYTLHVYNLSFENVIFHYYNDFKAFIQSCKFLIKFTEIFFSQVASAIS